MKKLIPFAVSFILFASVSFAQTYTVRLGPGTGDCGTVEDPCPSDCTITNADDTYIFEYSPEWNTIMTYTISQVQCGTSDEYLLDSGEFIEHMGNTFNGNGVDEASGSGCSYGAEGSTGYPALSVSLKADHPEEAVIITYTIRPYSNIAMNELSSEGLSCITMIPVELYSFTATPSRNHVALEWVTASETDNKGFEIERSSDGVIFENIGFERGHGNSAKNNDYTFIDHRPFSGNNYYRLKQVDYSGTFEYSDILTVEMAKPVLKVIGNPAIDELKIILDSDTPRNLSYTILNSLGKTIQEGNLTNHLNSINIQHLPVGNYFIRIIEYKKVIGTERFVKLEMH